MSARASSAPAAALLDEEHQLLEGELAAAGMHAGDRARVPGVDVAQVIERLLGAQLGEQDPIRLHAQTRLQQLLRRHARESLVVLASRRAARDSGACRGRAPAHPRS